MHLNRGISNVLIKIERESEVSGKKKVEKENLTVIGSAVDLRS